MRFTKLLAVFAMSGMLIFSGNTIGNADEVKTSVEVETVNADMNDFKYTYFVAPQNDKIFHQNISAYGMSFTVNIDAQGQVIGDTGVKIGGSINFEYTNPANNQFTLNNMPFYVEQSGENIIFYVQHSGKWNKFYAPDISVWLIDSLIASDFETMNENMKAIKSVEVYSETYFQKVFNITFDGEYLADVTQSYDESKDTTAYSADELVAQKIFFNNLVAALKASDITCTWIVDNQSNETIATIFDLTPLINAYAEFANNEDLQDSQMRVSTTYSNIDTKQKVTPPSGIRKGVASNDIFEEFIDGIVQN